MKLEAEISMPGFLVAMTLMSAFIAAASVSAVAGRTAFVFTSSLLMWISYLAAHKFSEGKFVDGKPLKKEERDGKDEKMTPSNITEYIGSFIGGSILVTGMGVGAHGVNELNLVTAFLGALLFNIGYVVAHMSTTGEPL